MASAQTNLSRVVALAAREPRDIYDGDKLVARVVAATATITTTPSAAELLVNIQRACAEDNYTLDVGPRVDRPNSFAPRPRRKRKRS